MSGSFAAHDSTFSSDGNDTPSTAGSGHDCHHLAVLEALDVGVVVQDRDLRIVYANAKATSLLGITTHEITSRTTVDARWDVVGPDGTQVPDDAHPGPRALRTGRAVQGVVLGVRRGDATERVWILVSAVPQFAADGSVERVLISFSDVSIAQRTLRAHEAIYFAVFRSMTEGLVIHNVDGSIRAANASAERVLGLTVEQMTGRHPMDPSWRLTLPDGTPAGSDDIPLEITTRTGTPARAQLGVHRPNGDLAWLDVHASPLHEPGMDTMTGVLATFADVTAERNALEALNANREQLERVFDAIPGVVYQYAHRPNREGRLTFAAGRIQEISGLPAADVQRNPQLLFSLIDPAHLDAVWTAIDSEVEALLPFEQVMPFTTAQGELRWGRVYGVPQETPEGVLYTGVILDATREQMMADALRRSQRREALGDMAGGIAHNFNNMLAVILPNVQLARELAREASDADVAQHLADAERAALSASDLVKRMLALGRVESRDVAQVDFVPIVREALHICRQTFDRTIAIVDDLAVREAFVRASASSMQQVVLNLLLNARDAMQGTVGPTLAVRLAMSGPATVSLTVTDTGSGMSSETLRRLGEPFYTTKAAGIGTGLGLASAFHSIAEAGGRWRVQSELGRGTTFTIDLPLVDTVTERVALAANEAGAGLYGTVLVIDDEPMVRTVLARQLAHAGMYAEVADGAEAALAMLARGVPGLVLILLDLSMPGVPGEQALPMLRAAAPNVPVVALSGHIPESMVLPGVAAVLQKPLGQRELVEAVRLAVSPP